MALTRRCAVLLLVLAACGRREPPKALGRAVVAEPVLAMRASADGAFLAYLRACRPVPDRTLPAGTSACELAVVPASGGAPVRIAAGVSTLAHGFGWAPAGHVLAAIGEYDHATGNGALIVWAGGEPRRLATGVTFHSFDRDGARVGWIAGGQLFVAAASGGATTRVDGADRLSTFEFGRGRGIDLLARRTARAGGTLLAVRGSTARPLASEVSEYGFAPDGAFLAYTAGPARALAMIAAEASSPPHRGVAGRDVQRFLFSPRSRELAFVADAVPGRQGDLWVMAGGAAPVLVARNVGEPRWTEDGRHLVWLQDYDPRSRTGMLVVGRPGAPPRVVARNVSDFDVTTDGTAVAGLVHDTAAGYSVNLALAAGTAAPATVARGVFGFGFSPDGRWLYYRTACTREAEACDLLRIPGTGLPAGGAPERIAEAAKSFDFAPGRPERLLVTWSRKDRAALDLAVWEGGRLVAVDTSAVPGSARFLGGSPSRIAYVVNDPKRPGVYVADVP